MNTSTFVFILVGCTLLFGSSTGKMGTIAYASVVVGLSIVGAYLLVNGY